MNKEIAEMIDEKRRFIDSMQFLLLSDDRSGVDSISYSVKNWTQDDYDEYIDINYKCGTTRRILTTGNSNGANLIAVAREVYG